MVLEVLLEVLVDEFEGVALVFVAIDFFFFVVQKRLDVFIQSINFLDVLLMKLEHLRKNSMS